MLLQTKPKLEGEVLYLLGYTGKNRVLEALANPGLDVTWWRKKWLNIFDKQASSVYPGQAVTIYIEGLEKVFKRLDKEEERISLRSLLQDVLEDCKPYGLIIDIPEDLVKKAIVQNFGQFKAKWV